MWSTVVIKIVVWSFVVRFCQSVCLLLLSTLSLIVCKPVYLQSVPPLGVPPTPPEQARSPPQTIFPQPEHPPNTIPKMMHFRMSLSIGCRCDFWPMVGCNWVYLVHMFHNPAHLVVACWGWGPAAGGAALKIYIASITTSIVPRLPFRRQAPSNLA